MSKSEGQVLDFEKICRLCLLEKRSMSAIFSKKKSDKKVPLPVRIMSCASLELYEGDGLPASICSKCLLSVNQSYAFREQCEQADTTLRQYAQRMNEASEETSTNREPGERIANDSLEHVQDNGNNKKEGNIMWNNEFDEQSHKLELKNCQDETHVKNICPLNFKEEPKSRGNERNLAANDENSTRESDTENIENKKLFSCRIKNNISPTNSGSLNYKKFVSNENDAKYKKNVVGVSNNEFTDEEIQQPNAPEKCAGIEPAEIIRNDCQRNKDSDNLEVQKFQANAIMNSDTENILEYPALRSLSTTEAENVVVVADVESLNTKYPSDGEDGDHVVFSSSEEDSCPKTQERNWARTGCRNKRDIKFSQVFKSIKRRTSEESISAKSSFSNRKHLELLQNLLKNKNIVVKRRAVSNPTEFLTGKSFTLKNQEFKVSLRRKRGISFPKDFKIAQLWKEWEEVNKRIPQKNFLSEVQPEELPKSTKSFKTLFKEGQIELRPKKRLSPEVVFEEGIDHNKGDEDGKLKWKNGKDTVYCKDCRIFLLRSSYSNHIKFVHEKVRKYLCQTCGYAACTGTILRQHVQAVHIGYSFFCDQCPKKFNLMKRLRKHKELQHSGKPIERNHICQYCGMAFVKPGCLKRHLRSHTQETPYQCQYCQRRFKYRWPKVQHERLHTGEKPYKCSFCEERFTQNCVRKAHEYKKHGNEEFKPKARARKEENVTSLALKSDKEEYETSRGLCRSGSESS